jgi:hypothetical protein
VAGRDPAELRDLAVECMGSQYPCIWNSTTFDRVVTLRGGTGQVRGLSFSADGQLLAGAAYTAPTIVWDLTAVRCTLGEMGLDW